MKRGLFVWLPQVESLDPTPPADAQHWAAQAGCCFAQWDQWESQIPLASFLVTVCSSEQVDWLPQVFGKLSIPLLVYGPDASTVRYFEDGVLRSAQNLGMPSQYDGPLPQHAKPSTASTFFRSARKVGWSPELSALRPAVENPSSSTAWIAVEGADGAGKSTQAAKLKLALAPNEESQVHRSCRSGSFYQEVSELLQASVLHEDRRGWRWGRLWKIFDSLRLAWARFEASSEEPLVWDRYLETHLAATRMRFGDDCGFGALIDSAPTCAQQVYLDLPEAVSASRRAQRVEVPTLDEHEVSQRRYRQAFRAQSRLGRMHRIAANGSVEEVHSRVVDVLRLKPAAQVHQVSTVAPPQWEQRQSCTALQLWSSKPIHFFAPSPDQNLGMDWAGFLDAMHHAGDALPMADRIDLLALEMHRREKAADGSLQFPLWPPLLRAVHGLPPSYEPASLPRQPQWRGDAEIAAEWKVFFASVQAEEEYLSRAYGQREELEVSGVLLINQEGEVFLEQRHPAKPLYPYRWDSPGGKLEAQESSARAAQREMEEEYGVFADLSSYQLIHRTTDPEPTTGRIVHHHIFALHVSLLDLTLGPDAIAMHWFSPIEALANPLLATPLREALPKLPSLPLALTNLTHDAIL